MFPEEADQLMKMLQQVFVHTVAIVKDRFWQSRQERMMGDFFYGDNIHDCGDSAETFLKTNLGKFAYMEAQLWYRP